MSRVDRSVSDSHGRFRKAWSRPGPWLSRAARIRANPVDYDSDIPGAVPERRREVASRRLFVLFLLTLAWYALLSMDAVVGGGISYWLAAGATLAFYPAAVACVVLLLQNPAPALLLRLPLAFGLRVLPILLIGVVLALLIDLPTDLSPGGSVGNDITASIVCAARTVLQGKDPYQESEVTCLHDLRAPIALGTPLQRGAFAHQRTFPTSAQLATAAARAEEHGGHTSSFAIFGYLPMAFVWILPVAFSGHQAWVAYTMLAALVWLVLAGLGAGPLWPALVLVLLAQIGDGGLMAAATQGDGEVFAYGAVVLALVWLDRPRLSAFFMGLGMAWHPLIWVVWAGYALLTKRLPEFGSRMAWSLATAGVLTTPWLVWEHGAVRAILALIFQPNFPSGVGLVLALGPGANPIYRHALLGLVIAAYCSLSLYAWRHSRFLPALPVVGLAFLWLSWRSDVSYLSELFPLAAAMTVGLFRLEASGDHGVAKPNLVDGSP